MELASIATVVALVVFAVALAAVPFFFRIVVPSNEVHIVQSGKATRSHGRGTSNGNAYYKWPSWVPYIGVTVTELPMSVFDIDLTNYEAYDQGRLPFIVDVKAFFRIDKSDSAAERVSSFDELKSQLKAIVQGSVRTILAQNEIEGIMRGRGEFGEQFTNEVREQLLNWGVVPVKNIELMDIRDAQGSKVIGDIMAKKQSDIERESRITVAQNKRAGEVAEIEAKRDADLIREQAQQAVGVREAERVKLIGIAQETSAQEIAEQAKTTKELQMAVERVAETARAAIDRDVAEVVANQDKITAVLKAEADLQATKLAAEGIRVEGEAVADALKAKELAPIQAQIELAKEIGSNTGYQQYLISMRAVEAQQVIGSAQAEALKSADVKVIANAGDSATGMSNVMDMFSAKGGTNLASMLEGLAQSEVGAQLLSRLTKGAAAPGTPPTA